MNFPWESLDMATNSRRDELPIFFMSIFATFMILMFSCAPIIVGRSYPVNLTNFRGSGDWLWRIRLRKQLQYRQWNSHQPVILVSRTRKGICEFRQIPGSSGKSNERLGTQGRFSYLSRKRWLYFRLPPGRWIKNYCENVQLRFSSLSHL